MRPPNINEVPTLSRKSLLGIGMPKNGRGVAMKNDSVLRARLLTCTAPNAVRCKCRQPDGRGMPKPVE